MLKIGPYIMVTSSEDLLCTSCFASIIHFSTYNLTDWAQSFLVNQEAENERCHSVYLSVAFSKLWNEELHRHPFFFFLFFSPCLPLFDSPSANM